MNNEQNSSKIQIKDKLIKRNLPDVPELILAYTYFLNDNHSSHICIGYDNHDFMMKIVLYKNNIYQELKWDEWLLLFLNKSSIQNHFEGVYNVDFVELPKIDGQCSFKLSMRNNEKCFISILQRKKIILYKNEWEKLYSLIPFIHSIANWYVNNWKEIEKFYLRYLTKCIEKNVFKLMPHEFFIGAEIYGSFNDSRLFNELSTISRKKLINDIYLYNVNVFNKSNE